MKSTLRAATSVLVLACAHNVDSPAPTDPAQHPFDVSGRALDGTEIRLADLRGNVVLVDVWATWCMPCRYSLPVYRELYEQYRDRGFVVVGINVDEDDEAVRGFLEGTPLPFPIVRDPRGAIPTALGVRAMPTSFLIDRRGAVRLRHEGFTPGDAATIRASIDEMLAESTLLVSEERPLMGTVFRVSIPGPDSPKLREAIAACFSQFEQVDRTMSEWQATSPVSEINRQAGVAPVPIPDDLFELLETAKRVSDDSEGAFDVTWAALGGLWKFDGTDRVPTAEEVEAGLSLVGSRDLVLDRDARTAMLSRQGMAIGLGGIAKGYALDLAQRELQQRGFSSFLLYAGGQIYAAGQKEDGPWKIGIQDPRGAQGDSFAALDLRNSSVSTSGDYEHAFTKDGVLYHHIIDLRSGFPARGSRSATVVHADPTLADAYSTAAFVLGPEKGLELARRRGFELLIVGADGSVHMTEKLRERVRVLHAPTAAP